MPKGVEHSPKPLDDAVRRRVSNSVMPKGVEHIGSPAQSIVPSSVPNSVMPKGVEHVELHRALAAAAGRVPNSVMPKGVEHRSRPAARSTCQSCAEFSDAERR